MSIGSCWRRAWGFRVRGEKKKREVWTNWRNSRDLWEEPRPGKPGPRLGTGQQSAAVTSRWAPRLYCMKITFDKSSYPGDEGEGKVSIFHDQQVQFSVLAK